MTVDSPSNRKRSVGGQSEFWEEGLRLTGATLVLAMIVVSSFASWAQAPPSPTHPGAELPPQQLGTITQYLGVPVTEIELPGVPAEEAEHLLAATPLKLGEPLTRQALHDTMQTLFSTGRFADIQADAERTTAGVRLRFLTVPNYFLGQITADGVSSSPSPKLRAALGFRPISSRCNPFSASLAAA